jgi:integrase
MAVYKRGGIWWYSFIYAGKRVQESAKTSRKTVAVEAERGRRLELERALSGLPTEGRERRIRSVTEVLDCYADSYGLNHRQRSTVWVKGCVVHLKRHLGSVLLPDLTERVLHGFIRARLEERACGRTINMDLGTLSRAMGNSWRTLWPNLRKLEERKDAGRALSPEEEGKLVEAIPVLRSVLIGTFVRVALMTGMRAGEIISLTWGQVDLTERVITVGRAKTSSGTGRQIPMNQELAEVLSMHAAWFTARFRATNEADYLFPWGSPFPTDPTRPTTTIKTAWENLRAKAGVSCRLHDLRHTAATKMAEAGIPESTMLSLMGHMSRAMLERYSHIRMAAKREAVESLSVRQKPAKTEVVSTVSTTVGKIGQLQ